MNKAIDLILGIEWRISVNIAGRNVSKTPVGKMAGQRAFLICFSNGLFGLQFIPCLFTREELKEQLEKKKKGSRALADFEDKMNDVCLHF